MKIKKITKKQINLFLCLFAFCFSVAASTYEPFSGTTPMQNELVSEVGPSDGISPFESSTSSGDPALYGPGGDPIGGLPVKNAPYALLIMASMYALFKAGKIKKHRVSNH